MNHVQSVNIVAIPPAGVRGVSGSCACVTLVTYVPKISFGLGSPWVAEAELSGLKGSVKWGKAISA